MHETLHRRLYDVLYPALAPTEQNMQFFLFAAPLDMPALEHVRQGAILRQLRMPRSTVPRGMKETIHASGM